MPKLLVLVPGIGEPHWDTKMGFLANNHRAILATLPPDMELHYLILQYSPGRTIPMETLAPLPASRVSIVEHPGLLGENLHRFAKPEWVARFDYVFMMLDDIEFGASVPWDDLLFVLGNPAFGTPAIVSPCLKTQQCSSWDYMRHISGLQEPTVICRNKCEFFVYFMRADAYTQYYRYIDPTNPFLWGMDFLLATVMGLPPAILNHWVITHHYRGTSPASRHAMEQATAYMERRGLSYADAHRAPPGDKRFILSKMS